MFDALKLESLLVKNWTEFIDPRKLFSVINNFASDAYRQQVRVERVSLTRFELTPSGFVVWADYQFGKTTGTTEFILAFDGAVRHVRTT